MSTVVEKISKYKDHKIISMIKKNITSPGTFSLPNTSVGDINKTTKSLDISKTVGLDSIPVKLVKMSSNIIDTHLCIINIDIK